MRQQRLTPIYSEILNRSWSTPVTLNFFDGRTVVIRDHYFPADDLYCIAMGWYDLPWATRFAVVKNLTFLEELSEETCEQLSKSIPDYFNISMQDMINETYVSETFMINLEIDACLSQVAYFLADYASEVLGVVRDMSHERDVRNPSKSCQLPHSFVPRDSRGFGWDRENP